MKFRMIALLAAALPFTLWACNNAPELDIQTFTLEHRSAYEAEALIGPYVFTDRPMNQGTMSATNTALTVRETRDNLEKIARVLEEFDQPLDAIRLRFQLIEADSFQETDPGIAEITEELKSLFQFEGYRLMGEALVTVAGGYMDDQEASQRFLGTEEVFLIQLQARVERPGSVRLNPIRLWMGEQEVILETSVNVRKGQTVVIGGARGWDNSQSYILVVKAETEG